MAIMRWDPFGEMLRMQREMDRILSRFGAQAPSEAATDVAWMPKIDVKQKGDDLVIRVELPGVKPEDVDVEVTDNVLTIRGQRVREEEQEGESWLICESCYGTFERSMVLPEGVKPEAITADFKHGVLEIHVPKAVEAAQPKTTRIEIGKK